jgi:hypothetical protein
MPGREQCINPPSPTLPRRTPNAFSPEFLDLVRGEDETLTAAEAAASGPWKVEPVPGRPGRVAVVRMWENLERGDRAEAVFCQEETARLFAAILPLAEREPLFSLADLAEEPDGFPLSAMYGEQGACTVGWLSRAEPAQVAALHLAEALTRRPDSLAILVRVAGGGAIEQIGRILAPDPETAAEAAVD